MAYTLHGYGDGGPTLGISRTMDAVKVALTRAIARDGRFTANVLGPHCVARTRHMPEGWQLVIDRVRLAKAKPYCGNHPGPCAAGTRKKRLTILEWDDWVAFHIIVNDVLDRLEVTADVWTNPSETLSTGKKLWIRKDNRRRVRFDWSEQWRGGLNFPLRVWNAGTPDQFESPRECAAGGV